MSAKTITVVATFQAKPGKTADLKKALLSLIAPTHQEAGCINYDLHQSPEDPEKFLFHENWTSKAHLDAHPSVAAAHGRTVRGHAGNQNLGKDRLDRLNEISR
jgi:quinol monooxygenase YgiN